MNLGQSQFQDAFFVVGAQLTPFKQLRQIELELRQIDQSIKASEFASRRLAITISKLDANDPEQSIDLEEAQWNATQSSQLLEDAKARKANFELMREQLLARVPKEYWDQGYENAELDYWTIYCAKQISLARALGCAPPLNVLEMTMQLPEDAQIRVLQLSHEGAAHLQRLEQMALPKPEQK